MAGFKLDFFCWSSSLITKPLGVFMTRVFSREKTFSRSHTPTDRETRVSADRCRPRSARCAGTEYAVAMLLFSGVSMGLLYLIERTQKWLPFNPQKFPNVEARAGVRPPRHRFTTNTKLAGLLWRIHDELPHADGGTRLPTNFASAAVGIVLGDRGDPRHRTQGNRQAWKLFGSIRLVCLLWVLLPVCLVGSLVLVFGRWWCRI